LVIFTLLRILAWLALPFCSMHLFYIWGFGKLPQLTASEVLPTTAVGLAILIFITPLRRSLIRLTTRQVPRNKKLASLGRWLVCLAIFISIVAFWHRSSRNSYRTGLFRRFVADPVPARVQVLDATSFKWQDDWSCNLLFKTDKSTFQELAKDYQPFTLDERTHAALLWRHYDRLYDPVCYRKEVKLSDEYYDDCYLFWDKTQGQAYFHLHGGQYQR